MIAGRIPALVAARQVRYVTPVPPAAAHGLVARVYGQIAEEMGLVVPPALAHSPAPDTLAAYWLLLREPLLPTGVVARATKETVATAVSVANTCPYCVDMHSVSMYDLRGEQDAEAVAADRVDDLTDPGLREIAAWARAAHRPGAPAAPAALAGHARAELVGVLVGMHYVARMVNVFMPNFLLPPGLGPRGRRRFKRGVSRLMRPTLRHPREPGRSLDLLPAEPAARSGTPGMRSETTRAPGAREGVWAAGRPAIAGAFTAASAAFEAAGERSLPAGVRRLVLGRLADWRGEDAGPDIVWCERLTAGMTAADRSAGRLALLTAFASYRVSADVVGEFRRHHPGDAPLVEATAWASFAAARLIGERQPAGDTAHEET